MKTLTPKLVSWASIIEPDALAQAQRISEMGFIYPHVAIMPDVHLGKGAAIGLAIPTLDAILPAAVGVDIGCGMMAEKTQWKARDLAGKDLSVLREAIEKAVPLSAGGRNGHVKDYSRGRIDQLECYPGVDDAYRESPDWPLQLGTLGSGNHFIEVTLDEEDSVWLFLHSGSRGVGNRLAMRHIKVAKEMCKRYGVTLSDPDLAYLASDSKEFWEYYTVLRWAQKFALLNREEMMFRVSVCISEWMDALVDTSESVQCHHNYTEEMPAELRAQFPEVEGKIFLSRKGAIDASLDKPGLIPGSMGDASYVVRGKSNTDALWTSPHGAGRLHSRGSAKRTFTLEDLEVRMQGIEWRHTDAFLDEHPNAYKDIGQVMEDSKDLVSVRHQFRQVVNVKGN